MHIFFVEGESHLARALIHYAQSIRGIRVEVYQGDLENLRELELQLTALSPDFVVNSYEFSDYLKAEQRQDQAWQINAIFPDHLAHICLELSAGLLHISSDEVIGETRGIPFHEKDTVHPINAYGESKWQGEEAVRQLLKRHIILRLGSLFSGDENGWTHQLIQKAASAQGLQEAADITLSPTATSDVARVVIGILQQLDAGADCWGTFQYAGVEAVSRASFAEQVIQLAQDRGLLTGMEAVRSVSAASLGLAGLQALHREMNCQKIMDHFGIKQRSWRPELVACLEYLADSLEAKAAAEEEN
ncbi:dTDP-4-dehydrorhamnose reductase [Oceanospirillum multiglobuliferum]|uniref:dTDP-4-dehydrorhamnose reductase n=1 Tax=Oceanospirillum multiglobuliferum TaxID=64969 RepID=A0A1T4RMD8_9GAMM|nr:sugar nucleotide-binding protein [Oceanospirillum multiglobuliferum]OPX54757.1 hypothetical protein BTE48_12700 [Oceanospirillum multiglobuliferum]SKA17160.1 dTDP-4-dehydrorhamnose reductase [Oceanospirillum multiglobuliferum]